MKKLISIFLCAAMVLSCMGAVSFAADESFLIASIEEYKVYSSELADDGYIGIPVGIKTYSYKNSTQSSPVMLYVVNTNTKRIGTDTDENIIISMLERGYIVTVIDYYGNAKAVSPALDWSVQQIRGNISEYIGDETCDTALTYVVPSGYNVTLNEYYWSIDKHGTDGILEKIVDVWNDDFMAMKGSKVITLSDGTTTTVKEYTQSLDGGEATDITQLIKPDGTPIDMDLRMDIIYPANPENEVPVMIAASSSETRVGVWTMSARPHLSGFLFNGYAGVIMDYAYIPMARNDHYGYFDGTSTGSLTGDNLTYSVGVYSGVKSDTAAIRKIRYLADYERDKYKFDLDKFGIYGNSKAGIVAVRLGVKNPELLSEERYFDGHHGESRYENGLTDDRSFETGGAQYTIEGGEAQPWLTYSDGSEIPSNVQFVYANCGGGWDNINSDYAPMYVTGSMKDGSYYNFFRGIVNECFVDDVPAMVVHCPERGHEFAYGPDRDYGIDTYYMFHRTAGYWLRGDSVECAYIDVTGGKEAADTNGKVTVKFTGAVNAAEIDKIKIVNALTGKASDGYWTSSFGETTWEFNCVNMDGGMEYNVIVPSALVGANGKKIKQSKGFTFKTQHESVKAAELSCGNSDMTLVKTENSDDGIYYMFDISEASDSTTVDLRFKVENEAANTVLVYGVEELDTENLENSVQGELLGEVVLAGDGNYSFDVTEYIKSADNNKAGIILRAKKNKETKLVSKYDFESEDVGDFTDRPYFDTEESLADEISEEQNHTSGGSKSYKVSYNTHNSHQYHPWVSTGAEIATLRNLLRYGSLESTDYGKKYKVSLSVYDTTSRRIGLSWYNKFVSGNVASIDWNGIDDGFLTEPGKWCEYTTEYQIDNPIYYQYLNKKTLKIGCTVGNLSQDIEPLYLDDVTVYEEITEVDISTGADENGFDASLVFHPANTVNLYAEDAAYVENGSSADSVMDTADGLLISAGMKESNYKKAYVKLSLADFESGQAFFGFTTGEADKGSLEIYGVSDKDAASDWSSTTLNYSNAPANDLLSYGADKNAVYGGEPIATIELDGSGEYSVDISDYAEYMKGIGAEYVTLILVNPVQNCTNINTINFDEGTSIIAHPGGGLSNYGYSSAEDHTGNGGRSYYTNPAAKKYERIRIDVLGYKNLTEADIGRSFKVTYWAKANEAGTFRNGLMACSGTSDRQWIIQTMNEADTWQEFEYTFTLTGEEIADVSNPESGIYALLDFEFDNMPVAEGTTFLYIDDITVEEINTGIANITPASKSEKTQIAGICFDDWTSIYTDSNKVLREVNDNKNSVTNGGFTTNTVVGLEETTDHTTGSGKSFFFTPDKNYNRLRFYNVFDHNLTEEDKGRVIEMSFWLKADAACHFEYGLTSSVTRETGVAEDETADETNYSETVYLGTVASVSEADVGVWKQYSFRFTIDDIILPKTVGEKEVAVALFTIKGNSTSPNTIGKTLYIDDIVTYEIEEPETDAVTSLKISDCASVDEKSVSAEKPLVVTGNSLDSGNIQVQKAYLYFSGVGYEYTQKATLNIDVTEANGQTLKVYGIANVEYNGDITFNTAPDTSGYTPTAEITVTQAGIYSIDVTDYFAENVTDNCVFVIATDSESIGTDGNNSVVITKDAELIIEVAKEVEAGEQVTLNVSVVNGSNVNINGADKGDITTENVYAGNVLKMSATGDGAFLYWIDSDAKTILSYDENYSYTVGSDRSIAAVYADSEYTFVTFTSMANKLVAAGVASSMKVPENPYVYGYKFDGWYAGGKKTSLTAGQSIDAAENTEYIAGFKKDTASYTVTADGMGKTYTYNEKAVYTAEAEKDGKVFSYWKRDGAIASYNKEYSFYVNGDTTLESVYGENAESGPVLAMATPVLVDGSKIAFYAERDIPEEYEMVENGILMHSGADVNLENYTYKAIAKSTANKGQYTVRKANVSEGESWYAVAYAIVRKSDGTTMTVYSNEVSKTL